MNHWVAAPVLLPALLAVLQILLHKRLHTQRALALLLGLLLLALAIWMYRRAPGTPFDVYLMGNWPAPFGIVLVLDRLSALMLLLSATLSLTVLAYSAASGWDARGRHFHPLFQFQIMGINGAFLTGDLFNLFVFFEVMLIASYGLMVHSGGTQRLASAIHYVVINLAASALFLIGLGTLYAVTGTLNMADMAERIAAMPPADVGLMRIGATVLLIVFATKAALVPLHFWLPTTYAEAPAPVAALFALMTKVGAYAILRCFTLVFPDQGPTAGLTEWLLPTALATLALGAIGTLAALTLPRLAAFASLASMGTVLTALSLGTPAGTGAALYYMLHSTLAGAALFLLADLIATRRSPSLTPEPTPLQGPLGTLFLIAAIAMAGFPPLAGFLGKLLLLQAAWSAPQMPLIWATILATSFLLILAFARAGSTLFWASPTAPDTAPRLPLLPAAILLALLVALAAGAGSVTRFTQNTAHQLSTPHDYIDAVLGEADQP